MTKILTLALAALAVAGCAEEPVQTETPIVEDPAEVVTVPTDDAVMDSAVTGGPMMDDGVMTDSLAVPMTEGDGM